MSLEYIPQHFALIIDMLQQGLAPICKNGLKTETNLKKIIHVLSIIGQKMHFDNGWLQDEERMQTYISQMTCKTPSIYKR